MIQTSASIYQFKYRVKIFSILKLMELHESSNLSILLRAVKSSHVLIVTLSCKRKPITALSRNEELAVLMPKVAYLKAAEGIAAIK